MELTAEARDVELAHLIEQAGAPGSSRLGITQPRVSEIMRSKLERPSLDYVIGLCGKGDSRRRRLAA